MPPKIPILGLFIVGLVFGTGLGVAIILTVITKVGCP